MFQKHIHTRVFISRASTKPLEMGLPRASAVKLNRLRTGVGRVHLFMCKWGLAPSSNCECDTTVATTSLDTWQSYVFLKMFAAASH